MKTFLSLLFLNAVLLAGDITGFWKTIDEKTGKQQSVIAIYPYNGRYYGRIVATFDDYGRMKESMYSPKERAPGVKGRPFYCGMDIIWNVQPAGKKFGNGKILDPEHGNIYDVELWTRGQNLVVRGKLLFFGRNQTWVPAQESDFAQNFQRPDLTKFVPQIPRVK